MLGDLLILCDGALACCFYAVLLKCLLIFFCFIMLMAQIIIYIVRHFHKFTNLSLPQFYLCGFTWIYLKDYTLNLFSHTILRMTWLGVEVYVDLHWKTSLPFSFTDTDIPNAYYGWCNQNLQPEYWVEKKDCAYADDDSESIIFGQKRENFWW